jgi:hypothetical protein
MSRQQRIGLDRVAMVDRINHDLQRFRLVGDLVQVDDFDASERLAVVVDERGLARGRSPRIGVSTEGG